MLDQRLLRDNPELITQQLGRLLLRRCGPLTSGQQEAIAALPLETLEQLGEALLDFNGPDDLNHWLAAPKPGP